MIAAERPGPVLLVGASHQGEVVAELLRAQERAPEILGFLDCGDTGEFVGRTVSDLPVLATLAQLGDYAEGIAGVLPTVGDGALREAIDAACHKHDVPLLTAIHPSAVVSPSARFQPGVVVCARAVVGVQVRLGRAAIVNTGAIVDHHCRIGDYAHVAPGACLAGNVRVGERVQVGLGARIIDEKVIGPDAVVGAGAVVTRDVSAGSTVVGVPARPITSSGSGEHTYKEKDLA